MSVLVIGTTALDSIKTPKSENPRLLGGSASHAAVASSFFAPTRLMGVVGGGRHRHFLHFPSGEGFKQRNVLHNNYLAQRPLIK